LFDAAAAIFPESPAKAQRLVAQAHSLVLRSRIKLPAVLKRRYCKQCHALWVPGKTVRVRITKGRLTYTCLNCKRIRRIPLK
jgi:ribonuclease P protein subunit RPR2